MKQFPIHAGYTFTAAQYFKQFEGAKDWETQYMKIIMDMGFSVYMLHDSICLPANTPKAIIEEFERRVREIKIKIP